VEWRWRREGRGSEGEMGRAACSPAKVKKSEEVKVVSAAKSEEKGVVVSKASVQKGTRKGGANAGVKGGGGVKKVTDKVSKKASKKGGRRRSKRGGKKGGRVAPLGAEWSTREWAAVGLMTKATAEKPKVTLRDMRRWWRAYAPGPVRKDYGVLQKELEGLSQGKLVRLSLGGKRARVTATGQALLFG
jgi:hypothetical protein